MKRVIVRIGTLVSIVVMILIGSANTVMAEEEYDCPASIDSRGTTQYANAYGVFDSATNTTTYNIKTANKPGAEIIELCIYPNPDIDISDSDLTPSYDNWQIDNPGNKPGFGFIGRGTGATRMPLDGATNTVGTVKYDNGPSSSETLLLHVSDTAQCGPGGTCWMFPSTGEPVEPIPPVANPGGPYTETEGIAVVFNGLASSDPDNNIVLYSWDFGDGNIGTGINPSHTYAHNGTYTVSLTVTDESGLTNTNTTTVTITDKDPVTSFTGIPLTGTVPLEVTFTDSSSSYDGITSWEWDFENDGNIDSIIQNPTHIYTSAGIYTAKLTVCESDGDCVSSTVTVTVTSGSGGGDTVGPTQPLCPVAISTGPTSIYFSWWASTDNVGVAGYKVYRSTDNVNFYQIATVIATVTNTFYADTGLDTGTTYYYAVEAFDTSGNPSIPSDVVYVTPRDIEPPIMTVPSNIISEATSPVGAVVNFYASATDDIDGPITPICSPSSGSTFRLGLTTVTCTATDSANNIGSTVFSITVVDTISPTPPSGLIAIAISTSRIDLSWTASYDAVGVARYWIYRSTDNINFASIGSTRGTTFQNTGLVADTTYYYYIIAIDAAGNPSGPSNTANAKTFTPGTPPIPSPIPPPPEGQTPPPSEGGGGTVGDIPPTLTVPTNIIIEATSPSGTIVTYSVFANDQEDGDITSNIICSPPSGSMFSINTTTVTCWVTDSGGNTVSGIFTVTVSDTTPPTPPSGLTAVAISTTRIDLSWTASTDIVGVVEYRIYRSLNNINFMSIGTAIGTVFSNTGLIPNTTYNYYIIAYDAAGNPSDPSNIASAKTFVQPPSPPPTPGPSPSPTETGGPEPSPTVTVNPCSPEGNTQQGQAIQVTPISSVDVKFDAVLQCGETTAVAYYDNQWTPLPNNYKSTIFYDIDTTSTYANYITIKIVYPDPPLNVDENSLRMFHYENENWIDVTIALDTVTNTITGRVSSLSPFGIGGAASSGGGSGGSSTSVRGSSINDIGIIMLSICLIVIGISKLYQKKGKI